MASRVGELAATLAPAERVVGLQPAKLVSLTYGWFKVRFLNSARGEMAKFVHFLPPPEWDSRLSAHVSSPYHAVSPSWSKAWHVQTCLSIGM